MFYNIIHFAREDKEDFELEKLLCDAKQITHSYL
jgi:hypothetical protein